MLESEGKSTFSIHWKGLSWDYQESLRFQEDLVSKYKSKPYFIASAHAPVFSVGRSLKTTKKNIKAIPIVPVERGGKAMFHGPGQLTVYPVIKISDYFKGPRDYVCFLFCSIKEYFKEKHKIELESYDNGLWTLNEDRTPNKKVGFIGLRIKKGIAYHGFSLNYHCDLKNFNLLSPCNITGTQVGNLFKEDKNLEAEASSIIEYIINKLQFNDF